MGIWGVMFPLVGKSSGKTLGSHAFIFEAWYRFLQELLQGG